ncbi:AAA family ATPase [Neolewinella aquimaris]|uniref:AAA family ATPase n=1 Tax=Neolewinella aquimaris TaxID=1835722 RepID=UPI0016121BCD
MLVLGARQVGKTTLVRSIAEETGQSYLYLNADNANVPELLSKRMALSSITHSLYHPWRAGSLSLSGRRG